MRVYIYNTGTSSWTQRGNDIDGVDAGDESGYSVAISDDGNIMAIGELGRVRVYEWDATANNNNGDWDQLGSDITGNDATGQSVALSSDGSILALTAPGADGGGNSSGVIRVYKRDTNASIGWSKIVDDIDGDSADDDLGEGIVVALALSHNGEIVAGGASQAFVPSNNYQNKKGYVKVARLERPHGHISNFDYTPLTNLDFNASVSNRKEHHDDWQEGSIVGVAT